jgi:hypothetical protein
LATTPDVEPPPPREPANASEWSSPSPLGFTHAADSAGSVAAALLAGFALTLIGLIVADATKFRMPGLALSLLALSVVFFIAAVQCSFWAKQYAITPDDVKMWYPNYKRPEGVRLQTVHYLNFLAWDKRMNWAYRLGILSLLSGAAVTLVPRGSAGVGREAAIAIVSFGFVVELLWIFSIWVLDGSPSMGFTYTDDAPVEKVRFMHLRSWKPLRRFARVFVPYARVPPEEPESE